MCFLFAHNDIHCILELQGVKAVSWSSLTHPIQMIVCSKMLQNLNEYKRDVSKAEHHFLVLPLGPEHILGRGGEVMGG